MMNIKFDELSDMVSERINLERVLNRLTSKYNSSELIPNEAQSTTKIEQPIESDLDNFFKLMYDDYLGKQPKNASTITPVEPIPNNQPLLPQDASTRVRVEAPTPITSSTSNHKIPSTSQRASQTIDEEGETTPIQEKKAQNPNDACLKRMSLLIRLAHHTRDLLNLPQDFKILQTCIHSTNGILQGCNILMDEDYSLEQVLEDPFKPVMTRSKLATDPKMCIYAITVSTTEPNNIKEAMGESSWIDAM